MKQSALYLDDCARVSAACCLVLWLMIVLMLLEVKHWPLNILMAEVEFQKLKPESGGKHWSQILIVVTGFHQWPESESVTVTAAPDPLQAGRHLIQPLLPSSPTGNAQCALQCWLHSIPFLVTSLSKIKNAEPHRGQDIEEYNMWPEQILLVPPPKWVPLP